MIRNVHERALPVPAERVGELLDRIAEPGNSLWPGQNWPPLVLDRPLAVGAIGGHGPIRYSCTAYRPGRLAEFTFEPAKLRGTHTLEVLDGASPGTCVVRHTVVGTPVGSGRVAWPLAIRWMHDALIEDLLDLAAVAVGHPPARPARWSPWVRLVRAGLGRPPEAVAAN
ncbi:SRPBCC family protein [Solihabitans fulvus]|uniref:SRPBCC family protein n=1 Tax=Solihabitans fulvus TaxID=1892852 RepID=A0A5B2X6F2_9PSEU|nr:SRPBCC family protein [Solihabitans fulvus]KAA2258669.1 SRPBCC family protein [Solihabitans fulvus]